MKRWQVAGCEESSGIAASERDDDCMIIEGHGPMDAALWFVERIDAGDRPDEDEPLVVFVREYVNTYGEENTLPWTRYECRWQLSIDWRVKP